jgi:hypothetical protein
VLNEFNARKPDQLNIFKGITGNRLFMAIIAITVVLQVKALKYIFCLWQMLLSWFLLLLIPVLCPGTYHRVPWQVHVNSKAELAAVVGVDRSCFCQVRFFS